MSTMWNKLIIILFFSSEHVEVAECLQMVFVVREVAWEDRVDCHQKASDVEFAIAES